MTVNTHEDFHEIQLNGKQLVFLFMTATVVSVVIFLCGVLVGRGVRAEREGIASDATTLTGGAAAEPIPQTLAETPAPVPGASDPRAAPPPPAVDDLSYFNRLEKPEPPAEELKPAPERPPAANRASRALAPPAPKESLPATAGAPPVGPGYALQIAALRERGEADAIAGRLASKGYAAYVLAPANGTPPVYRVRIGKFKTRREAETMAAKLQREEQFTPWITR